ncbi:MAG: cytochrome c oxidase assembly protein [Pseudonocardiaceae bacterium]
MGELPPLTWHTALSTWTSAPVVDVLAVLAVAGYLVALRRLVSTGQPWPMRGTACFSAGVLVLLISVHSSIEVYGHALLWLHMIQHLLLIMVVPVLLVWGQPIRLVRGALGRAVSADSAWGGLPGRVVTFPVLTVGLYTAILVITHLTGFPEAMATQTWVHQVEIAAYLISGYLLFLPLVGAEASPRHVPHVVRFAVLAIAMGADTLVGVSLMLTGRPLAPSTIMLRPGWGPTLLYDQSAAGAIMWVGGDLMMMVLMLIVAAQWSAGGQQAKLGSWLESARRQSLARIGSESEGDRTTVGTSSDIDDDEAALQAYNRMLANLNRRSSRQVDEH